MIKNDDILTFYGDVIRASTDGKVGGYLVRFTSPQDPDPNYLTFFDARTDFWLDGQEVPMNVIYHHGLDGTLAKKRIGKGIVRVDDVGVWIQAQLDMHDEYVQALMEQGIRAGKMGWSSGTSPHLAEFVAMGNVEWVKTWPIIEASITPRPSEIRNEVIPLRALIDTSKTATQAAVEADDAKTVSETEQPSSDHKHLLLQARAYLITSDLKDKTR